MKIEYRDKAIFADTLVSIINNKEFDTKYGSSAIDCVLPKLFKPTNEAVGSEKTDLPSVKIVEELAKKVTK